MDSITTQDACVAELVKGAASGETMHAHGTYEFICRDSEGNEKWRETTHNIITTQGKNGMLDTYLAGSGYTAAWYMSLITTGGATAASTYATPSPAVETTSSVIANRIAVTWSAASGGAKASTTTTFSIIGPATIVGNMLVSGGSGVTTVANTAASGGILFSSSSFTGGSKSVTSGDQLAVSYSASLT